MIHHYSDLWRIHTESFDPEPRRYINCVKMRDTKVPKLLLSEATRAWDGRPVVRATEDFPSLAESRSKSPPPDAQGTYKKPVPHFVQRKEQEAMADPRFSHMFKKDGETQRSKLQLDSKSTLTRIPPSNPAKAPSSPVESPQDFAKTKATAADGAKIKAQALAEQRNQAEKRAALQRAAEQKQQQKVRDLLKFQQEQKEKEEREKAEAEKAKKKSANRFADAFSSSESESESENESEIESDSDEIGDDEEEFKKFQVEERVSKLVIEDEEEGGEGEEGEGEEEEVFVKEELDVELETVDWAKPEEGDAKNAGAEKGDEREEDKA